jgi:hypothetical protein
MSKNNSRPMLKFDRSPGNHNCGNEQTSMD